jgi:hypothetical protein
VVEVEVEVHTLLELQVLVWLVLLGVAEAVCLLRLVVQVILPQQVLYKVMTEPPILLPAKEVVVVEQQQLLARRAPQLPLVEMELEPELIQVHVWEHRVHVVL